MHTVTAQAVCVQGDGLLLAALEARKTMAHRRAAAAPPMWGVRAASPKSEWEMRSGAESRGAGQRDEWWS